MKFAALSSALVLTLAAGSLAYANADGTVPADQTVSQAQAAPALPRIGGLHGDNLVSNGDFEAGESGWTVVAPGGHVSFDRTGRGGSAGLVVRATEDTRVRAYYDIPAGALPPGSQLRAAAWIRASVVREQVRLTLQELTKDGAVHPVRETIRTYDRAWEPVLTTAVTQGVGSAFRLRVDAGMLPAGASLRLDDVWVAHQRAPRMLVSPSARRLDNGCAISQRGVPVCSAYFGAAYKLNDDPTGWEAELGRPLGVRRTYFAADQVESAVETARGDLAAGRLPWISFKMPYSWREMALGRGDLWVLDLSRRLSELPGPVWLAFHHEPEGDGDVAQWTAMQQRLAPMVRATAPNVAYTVILTGWNQLHGPEEYRLGAIWPKGTKVDVAGFDIYNFHGVRSDGTVHRRTTPIAQQYFEPISRWARRHGVAWGVSETGYTDVASRQDPAWLYRTYQQLLTSGGVAFTYFNSTANSIAPWDISARLKKAQFAYALRSTPRL